MSQHAGGHTIADIYKSVINDVISQVREAFLDENVDVDILAQLKKEWEDKVNSSGCVEMEPAPMPQQRHSIQPPPMRSQPVQGMQPRMTMPMPVNHVRVQPSTQQILVSQQQHHNIHIDQGQGGQRPIQMQYLPTQQNMQIVQPSFSQVNNQMRMMPVQPGQHYVVAQQSQQIAPNVVFVNNMNGQQIPVTMTNGGVQRVQVPSQLHQQQPMHQLDGGDSSVSVKEERGPSTSDIKGKKKKPTRKEAEVAVKKMLQALQLDGGRGRMSDSSSDEDEAEDDDDPLRRIADRIGDGQIEDGEQAIAEEEPLNSDDDQTDDEDLETLFDAENVIMCQFEKVHRARSKWKFQLKDGIMHISNKDFCFQKCSGEADW